jgi:hypothetical protein
MPKRPASLPLREAALFFIKALRPPRVAQAAAEAGSRHAICVPYVVAGSPEAIPWSLVGLRRNICGEKTWSLSCELRTIPIRMNEVNFVRRRAA